MTNPFFHGNPVPTDMLVDRGREIRRLKSRIKSGQSSAIVGEPRSGKTSLLLYLSADKNRHALYGPNNEGLTFSYLDAQTFGGEFSQSRFWEAALAPFYEQVIVPQPHTTLAQAYQTCRDNAFGCYVLDRLLVRAHAENRRLVLLLDEFDALLDHKKLNCAEFFGGMRSLATRVQSLALVIASRQSLTGLTTIAEQFSRMGSPYFNFLSEIALGPLPVTAVDRLLKQAKGQFTPRDRRFITHIAGEHPYLVQATASALWEAYQDKVDDPIRRWEQTGESLYDDAAMTLGDTWRQWPSPMRQAFTAVALIQIPSLLEQRAFLLRRFIRDMHDFGPELRELAKRGFVTKDESAPDTWTVRPAAFLWWLADELTRVVRSKETFENWLQGYELVGPLTRRELQQFRQALGGMMDLVQGGVSTLIEAAAKGIGAGIASSL